MSDKSGKRRGDNLLDYIPVRTVDWDRDDDGRVYLLKERSRNTILKKIIRFLHKDQFFRIRLDELGTAAWLGIDGKKDIYQITLEMKAQFADRLHQAEERVGYFFAMLKKNDFVDFL